MGIKTSIVSELNDNILSVSILNAKNLNVLYNYDFTVYEGFDKKGLIEDALFMYKRTLK